MKRKNTLRTIIILAFIVLALIYIYPSFVLTNVEQEEKAKIAELSALTGMSESEIFQNVYREDIDIVAFFYDLNLSADTLEAAREIVRDLQDRLYDKLLKIRKRSIKQGLDLQGGMHLVLQVDLVSLIDNLARKKDEVYYDIQEEIKTRMQNPDEDFYHALSTVFKEKNIPLNRYFGDMRDSEGDIISNIKKEAADAVNRSQEILRNRVDQFGVSEPSIQKQGTHRIVVELPGVHDPARARALIGKTALLEFKLLADADKTQKALESIDQFLKRDIAGETAVEEEQLEKKETKEVATAVADTAEAVTDTTVAPPRESKDEVVDVTDLFGGETTTFTEEDTSLLVDAEMTQEHPFYSLLRNMSGNVSVPEQNFSVVNRIIHRLDIKKILPSDYEFLWSNEPIVSTSDGNKYYTLYFVKREPEMTGTMLKDAQVQIDQGGTGGAAGQPIVGLEMNRQGAKTFARVTGANVGEFLAIVLDNKVHMAPRIKTKIPDGRAIIEGSFDMNEARDLAIVLRAGALPVQVEIIEERTVGPSLGKDSVSKGATSALAGLVIVVLFMLWYYRIGGVIADMALALNILFVMSILAGFQGTLTLPGIAGIILTIGMAVDANVLIYERIREELATGKTVKASIDAGYSRAIVTILDANVTTLIAAVVLYQFGTGPIQGFALTLMIGIIASMFTAIVVTRAVFDFIANRFQLKTLKI